MRLATIAVAVALMAAVCSACGLQGSRNPDAFADEADPNCSAYWDALVDLDVVAGENMMERLDPDGPENLVQVISKYTVDVRGVEPESAAELRERLQGNTEDLQSAIEGSEDHDDLLRHHSDLVLTWSDELEEYTTIIRGSVDDACPARKAG